MIVALTGFMGSGKTTVGAALAGLLGVRHADLDALVEAAEGRTVAEIFSTEGEKGFRTLELKSLKRFLEKGGDAVLSLGGGTLTIPAAAALVREKSLCIYLRATVETLADHLRPNAASRPLLQGAPLEERIAELLSARSAHYEENARAIVDTDGLGAEEIAEEIIIDCL